MNGARETAPPRYTGQGRSWLYGALSGRSERLCIGHRAQRRCHHPRFLSRKAPVYATLVV